jgi:hypothetical protein
MSFLLITKHLELNLEARQGRVRAQDSGRRRNRWDWGDKNMLVLQRELRNKCERLSCGQGRRKRMNFAL